MNSDKNCLSYWYPKLEEACVPTPKTLWLRTDCELTHLLDGIEPPGLDEFLNNLKLLCRQIGYPVFMRTGLTSGKHNWENTCYLADEERIKFQVGAIVDFSAMADFFGLSTSVWVLREFLQLKTFGVIPGFSNMPMAREFRGFINDHQIQCIHPYWPEKAVEQGRPTGDPEQWKSALQLMSDPYPDSAEIQRLIQQVAYVFEDNWSVDVCQTQFGEWYVTDMAIAEESFHWDGCVNAPKQVSYETVVKEARDRNPINISELLEMDSEMLTKGLLQSK